ncbi:ATP-binding protein [Peterkaempfera griseoplana]|uniref:ATP-binding protein n=1 Tax=Peterkaempfera griseoplana TaxID=66896 RepID=UPI0006E17170|nr:ATP-binding protein [Peterkaempfera griseoplana]
MNGQSEGVQCAVREDTVAVSKSGALGVNDARKTLMRTLKRWGLPENVVYLVGLCSSEVLTNALMHAGGADSVRVAWMRYGRVRVEVADLSPEPPRIRGFVDLDDQQQAEALEAVGGRGLDLVDELAAEWGWLPRRTGKVVWIEFDDGEVPVLGSADRAAAVPNNPPSLRVQHAPVHQPPASGSVLPVGMAVTPLPGAT